MKKSIGAYLEEQVESGAISENQVTYYYDRNRNIKWVGRAAYCPVYLDHCELKKAEIVGTELRVYEGHPEEAKEETMKVVKEYYVDWINEDQDQIDGRKPHNEIRSDGELTEAKTAEEAVENVRQWILEQIAGWTDESGNYYEWEAEEDNGDIIIWDISGEERRLIAAYLDFRARDNAE